MRTYSFLTTSEFFSHKISLSKSLVLFVIMLALSIKTGAVNNMIYYKLDGTVLHLSGTNKSGYSSSHTGNTVPNWRDACKDVVTEVIFDDKIQPDRITLWFCLFSKLEKITNMSNLDTSETTGFAEIAFCRVQTAAGQLVKASCAIVVLAAFGDIAFAVEQARLAFELLYQTAGFFKLSPFGKDVYGDSVSAYRLFAMAEAAELLISVMEKVQNAVFLTHEIVWPCKLS